MPRMLKIVLIAMAVGLVFAGSLFWLGKSKFEASERRMGSSIVQ